MEANLQPDSVDAINGSLYIGWSCMGGNIWNGCLRKLNIVDDTLIGEVACDAGISQLRTFTCQGKPLICTAQDDGRVVIYNDDLVVVESHEAHHDIVSCLAPNHSNGQLFTAAWDGSIIGWDWTHTSKNPIALCVKAHSSEIHGLNISYHSPWILASVGNDGYMRLWDTRTDISEGCSMITNLGLVGTAVCCSVTDAFQYFAGTNDGAIQIIDSRQPNILLKSHIHKERIRRISSNPLRPNIILSCSEDGAISVNQISAIVEQQDVTGTDMGSDSSIRIKCHNDIVSDLCWIPSFSNEQDLIISTSFDRTFRKSYLFLGNY